MEIGQAEQIRGSRAQVSQQRPQHLFIASLECQVQHGIAIAVQQRRVSAGLQQELDHLGLLGDDCQMQRRLRDSSTSSAGLTREAKFCTIIPVAATCSDLQPPLSSSSSYRSPQGRKTGVRNYSQAENWLL